MSIMNLRIQNPGQTEVAPSANPLPSNPRTGNAQSAISPVSSTYAYIGALEDTQDTASISAVPGQLSGELPIRQDRVDSLRSQIDAGTYTVSPRAVATAMFQNLFRS
jgi:anti-sigma28 factor (negative regulator of flagellin synthesis)